MFAVPPRRPYKAPLLLLTKAVSGLLLVQVPPVAMLLNVETVAWHMVVVPNIDEMLLIVTGTVVTQPAVVV